MTHQLSSMRGFCNNNHDLFFGSHQVEMESKNTTFGWLHHDDNYSQQVVQYSKNSKLARAAQELLCEFCSLAAGESSGHDAKNKKKKKKGLEEEGINIKDASWNDQSFCSSMDFMQLQKIKAKLLAMLEEVSSDGLLPNNY